MMFITDERDEPEVTPEMIEAGSLLLWLQAPLAEDDPDSLAREVYLAMARLAPREPRTPSPDTQE